MTITSQKGLALTLCLLVASACSPSATLIGSRAVPGARGAIQIKRSDNGNSQVVVHVEHLAPPGQVLEGATAYVVWVQNIDHASPPQNVGEIRVGDDLVGVLKTLTALPTFDLTITPETSAQVAAPGNAPVLSGRVERHD